TRVPLQWWVCVSSGRRRGRGFGRRRRGAYGSSAWAVAGEERRDSDYQGRPRSRIYTATTESCSTATVSQLIASEMNACAACRSESGQRRTDMNHSSCWPRRLHALAMWTSPDADPRAPPHLFHRHFVHPSSGAAARLADEARAVSDPLRRWGCCCSPEGRGGSHGDGFDAGDECGRWL